MASNENNTTPPSKFFAQNWQILLLAVYFALTGTLLLQNVYGFWPNTVEVAQDKALLREVNARKIQTLTDELKSKEALKDTLQPRLKKAIQQLDSIRYSLLTDQDQDPQQKREVYVNLFFWKTKTVPVDKDHGLLLLVLLMGALGSWLHAVSSFLDFVGNRNFVTSWITWYLMRPFLGAMMAIVFYVVIRAGLFPQSGVGIEAINPFSIAALAGLVGLFTQRATKKLADVFDALFPTAKKDQDPLQPKQAPATISQLTPDKLTVAATELEVQVSGNNFTDKSTAFVNGKTRTTSFNSKESLAFTLLPEDVAEPSELQIAIYDPAQGAETGASIILPVVAPGS